MTPIVLDASVALDLVIGTPRGAALGRVIGDRPIVAPAHVDAEVLSVLSRLLRTARIDGGQAAEALHRFGRLGLTRVPLLGLLAGSLRLRDNVSAGDAPYVVLARGLGAPLFTLDRRLATAAPDVARVPGDR